MRTKGALNKPKIVKVKLSDLCNMLRPDFPIPVCIDFARVNNLNCINYVSDKADNSVKIPTVNNINKTEDKIDFSITS